MSFLTKCYFYQIQLRGQQHQVTLSAPWSTVLQLAITGWGQGMAQTPPAVPHILSRSCYRNRRSHKLSLLDVNKQPHYFAESTLENQRPHHFILAQINEERLWGFFFFIDHEKGKSYGPFVDFCCIYVLCIRKWFPPPLHIANALVTLKVWTRNIFCPSNHQINCGERYEEGWCLMVSWAVLPRGKESIFWVRCHWEEEG